MVDDWDGITNATGRGRYGLWSKGQGRYSGTKKTSKSERRGRRRGGVLFV
jgi:hypothetical protein